MSATPLTPDQRRAAAMLAAGRSREEIASELDVAPKTISRWKERDDFREAIRRTREGLLPDSPTAEAVLVAALAATKPDGQPDWPARIAAAKALLATPVATPEGQEAAHAMVRETRIYLEPDDGAPRPFPVEGARS